MKHYSENGTENNTTFCSDTIIVLFLCQLRQVTNFCLSLPLSSTPRKVRLWVRWKVWHIQYFLWNAKWVYLQHWHEMTGYFQRCNYDYLWTNINKQMNSQILSVIRLWSLFHHLPHHTKSIDARLTAQPSLLSLHEAKKEDFVKTRQNESQNENQPNFFFRL